jgi:chaperone modulatory protein CbpM
VPPENAKVLVLQDAAKECGIDEQVFVHFIEASWIQPVDSSHFDEEDISRARLIRDLQNEFGVNEDAIPIILHLIDQLHALRRAVKSRLEKNK